MSNETETTQTTTSTADGWAQLVGSIGNSSSSSGCVRNAQCAVVCRGVAANTDQTPCGAVCNRDYSRCVCDPGAALLSTGLCTVTRPPAASCSVGDFQLKLNVAAPASPEFRPEDLDLGESSSRLITVLRHCVGAALRLDDIAPRSSCAMTGQRIGNTLSAEITFEFCATSNLQGDIQNPTDLEHRLSLEARAFAVLQSGTVRVLALASLRETTTTVASGDVISPSVAGGGIGGNMASSSEAESTDLLLVVGSCVLLTLLLVAAGLVWKLFRARQHQSKEIEETNVKTVESEPRKACQPPEQPPPHEVPFGPLPEQLPRAGVERTFKPSDDVTFQKCIGLVRGDMLEVLANAGEWLYVRRFLAKDQVGYFPESYTSLAAREYVTKSASQGETEVEILTLPVAVEDDDSVPNGHRVSGWTSPASSPKSNAPRTRTFGIFRNRMETSPISLSSVDDSGSGGVSAAVSSLPGAVLSDDEEHALSSPAPPPPISSNPQPPEPADSDPLSPQSPGLLSSIGNVFRSRKNNAVSTPQGTAFVEAEQGRDDLGIECLPGSVPDVLEDAAMEKAIEDEVIWAHEMEMQQYHQQVQQYDQQQQYEQVAQQQQWQQQQWQQQQWQQQQQVQQCQQQQMVQQHMAQQQMVQQQVFQQMQMQQQMMGIQVQQELSPPLSPDQQVAQKHEQFEQRREMQMQQVKKQQKLRQHKQRVEKHFNDRHGPRGGETAQPSEPQEQNFDAARFGSGDDSPRTPRLGDWQDDVMNSIPSSPGGANASASDELCDASIERSPSFTDSRQAATLDRAPSFG